MQRRLYITARVLEISVNLSFVINIFIFIFVYWPIMFCRRVFQQTVEISEYLRTFLMFVQNDLLYSIFNSNNLLNCLFWYPMKTIILLLLEVSEWFFYPERVKLFNKTDTTFLASKHIDDLHIYLMDSREDH